MRPIAILALLALTSPVLAAEKDLTLEVVANKKSYAWPFALVPKEFDAHLLELLAKQKKGEAVEFPKPAAVDLTLRITNSGKEAVTIHVGGDPNVFKFTLKGPGVIEANPMRAFTADFRNPMAVALEPGKSHDIPVTSLADGFRGASRFVYPTAPGEYKLSATYQLVTEAGQKGPLLEAKPIDIAIEEPKK